MDVFFAGIAYLVKKKFGLSQKACYSPLLQQDCQEGHQPGFRFQISTAGNVMAVCQRPASPALAISPQADAACRAAG